MTPAAGRDRGTYGGMLAVAVAAAVLSFSALAGLAELAGVAAGLPLPAGGRFRLAWLLPIAVDAYAVTATRVWLRTAGTGRTRGYARRNAVGAIPALSVAGNAAFYALTAAGVTTLADVRGGWLSSSQCRQCRPSCSAWSDTCTPWSPTTTGRRRPERVRPPSGWPSRPRVDRPVLPAVPVRPAGPVPVSRASTRGAARTDAELTAVLAGLPQEADGTVPIRRATAALGCGPDRARRLLAAAGLLRTPTTTRPPAELSAAEPITDDRTDAATPAAA